MGADSKFLIAIGSIATSLYLIGVFVLGVLKGSDAAPLLAVSCAGVTGASYGYRLITNSSTSPASIYLAITIALLSWLLGLAAILPLIG